MDPQPRGFGALFPFRKQKFLMDPGACAFQISDLIGDLWLKPRQNIGFICK